MATRSVKAARSAFYNAVRKNELTAALNAYSECADRDKYMLSNLVSLLGKPKNKRGRADNLAELWASVVNGEPELDAHLSSDFISGFGADGNLRMARRVLESARDAGLASTRVYNAYLRACDRSAAEDAAHALREASDLIARMEGADRSVAPIDAYTLALAARTLGHAGQLSEASALLERARDVADTVSHNALLQAAAKAGDVSTVLSTLQPMEDGTAAPPDQYTYNLALHALVVRAQQQQQQQAASSSGGAASSSSNASPSMDLPGIAVDIRERMAARGIAETDATRTCLLALFEDTPLGEAVLLEGPSVPFNADAPRFVEEDSHATQKMDGDGGSADSNADNAAATLKTDCRGLTRQAVSILLRQELMRAGERIDAGLPAAGPHGGGWSVLVSVESGDSHPQQQMSHNRGGGGNNKGGKAGGGRKGGAASAAARNAAVATPAGVTRRTAIEFFESERITCDKRQPGLLHVDEMELDRAAAAAANRARRERVRQGLSFYVLVVASGLAAMSVVPRLKASAGA